ncbi:uncharacterized protein TRAVEDRAFT_58548 [Trametes versicolor FP-101664 SS1]|uniref:uncharacterized protein n=1 Tax=Trametes versicolor (strain FP-101664) TaxID=717944 RepID=UPI00046235A5|nr:uncharacterized protein TRAVEDRAFT_58548 [Trametes versicolor FP-101664 SS1]EIW58119.1 hypothetical protein TRAVEDRAFT_58548 [Trametes versicolor FP-101664 SS1]
MNTVRHPATLRARQGPRSTILCAPHRTSRPAAGGVFANRGAPGVEGVPRRVLRPRQASRLGPRHGFWGARRGSADRPEYAAHDIAWVGARKGSRLVGWLSHACCPTT